MRPLINTFAVGSALILALAFYAPPASAQTWTAEGPGPMTNGQVENVSPNNEQVGAIHLLAAHPSDPDTLYIGGANGGIWKTTNATAASPTWVSLTDAEYSTSMGALELDPTDGTSNTLLAGFGRTSSFGRRGGDRAGLIRSIDGGSTWTNVSGGVMSGKNITGIQARGAILMASANMADSYACGNLGVFRSTDTGGTWSQLNFATNGIPKGSADSLEVDPNTTTTMYTALVANVSICDASGSNGIYKTTNSGLNWTKVSNAAMDLVLDTADYYTTNVQIAVSKDATNPGVVVAIATSTLQGVYHSSDGGANWTTIDLPVNQFATGGVHPGGQGTLHLSLAADPTNGNIFYIGGDRQPKAASWPNDVNAFNYTGRLFRGDVTAGFGLEWTSLTHVGTAGNSSPHADSRDMVFTGNNTLVEVDDGGIYRRTSPRDATGDWFSINSNVQTNEAHDTSYDPLSDIVITGNQDTGSSGQNTPGGLSWLTLNSGDGGDIAIDAISVGGESSRYHSAQNLGGFTRRRYDAANSLLGATYQALTVVGGGAAPTWQFVNPIEVNGIDGARLILGASNSVYESLDRAQTITEIAPGLKVSEKDAIAYGATGNANILYIATSSGIWVRTAAHPAALTQSYAIGGIVGVEVDPDNPSQAFGHTTSTVYHTSDTGGAWSDITGNLVSLGGGEIRSITYFPEPPNDALVIGTRRGVFWAREISGFTEWSQAGTGLPNAPVWDLDSNAANRKIIAGTLGRGAWSFVPAVVANWPPHVVDDSFFVLPSASVGDLVGTVPASDPENDTMTWSITAGNTNSAFSIDSDDGEVRVNNKATWEADSPFSLTVQVTDDGTPIASDTATIDITVAACPDPTLVTDLGNSGECTLRDRVVDAPGGSTITFDPSLANGTISLLSDIAISGKTLVIDGENLNITVTRSGAGELRLFTFTTSADITLRRLTLSQGFCNGSCSVSGSYGGAIYANNVTSSFDRIHFLNNIAGSGGGALYTTSSNTLIQDCLFSGNYTAGNGGAIRLWYGTLNIKGTTFSNNNSAYASNVIGHGRGTITISNSTISNNDIPAISSDHEGSHSLSLSNVTIANNSAALVINDSNGVAPYATATVINSIFSGNTADCSLTGSATVTDDGSNLTDNAAGGCAFNVTADMLLGALADNGGDTETRALNAGSPAIDAAFANNTECANALTVNGVDQRGAARSDGNCDIGAYEAGPLCSAGMTLTNGAWYQISMACVPDTPTVAAVFGDDGIGTYGTDWAVVEWLEASDSYRQLLEADTMTQGGGYWIKSINGDHSVDIDGGNAGNPYEISVVGDASGQFNLIGHPHNLEVDWDQVTVDVGGGTYKSMANLSATEATTIFSSAKWEYNGSGYDLCDPRGVCGASDDPTMAAFDGFWVKAFTNTTVRIPATPSRVSTRGLDPGEWYVRLIAAASSGSLLDRSNLFGRIDGAGDEQDSLDVEEPAPFGTPYLSVVFPHEEWQGDAWSYTTDYRKNRASGGDQWNFEVRSDVAREVTLSWQTEGDASILPGSRLVDEETGMVIDPAVDGTYTFMMNSGTHRFTWFVDSTGVAVDIFADGFESGSTEMWSQIIN